MFACLCGVQGAAGTDTMSRFLAVVLPSLTLCTHALLALSFLLPGSDLDRACFPIVYNVIAGSASILGVVGAMKVSHSLALRFVRLHVEWMVGSVHPGRSESQPQVH